MKPINSSLYDTTFRQVSETTMLCSHCQKETDHIVIQAELMFEDRGKILHRIQNVPLIQQPYVTYEEALNICFNAIVSAEDKEYDTLTAISLRLNLMRASFIDCCPNCNCTGVYMK